MLQELAISGLAAAALYSAGQHLLGCALGLLSAAYHTLVYLQSGRLLKPRSSPHARATPTPMIRPGPTEQAKANRIEPDRREQ